MTHGIFEYFSSLAVISYLFMFLIFLKAEKNNIVRAFLLLLVSMILWTGGSLLMRIEFIPSYILWYHVSLGGMFLVIYSYFKFITAFIGESKKGFSAFYLILLLGCFVINIPSGLFMKWPSIITRNGVSSMVYDEITGFAAVLFLIAGSIGLHVFMMLLKSYRKNHALRSKLTPIILGIIILFLGNLALVLPIFRGFPVDILAGVVNAGFILYSLVKKRLFKLTLMASESVGYLFCVLLGFLVFYTIQPYLELALSVSANDLSTYSLLIYMLTFVAVVSLLFALWKKVISNIFIREEETFNAILKKYSANVAKSLDLNTIFELTVSSIAEATGITHIYMSIPEGAHGNYVMRHSNQSLADLSLVLKKDNPLITCLKNKDDLLKMDEFSHSVDYKSMWENEKYQLSKMKVQYALGLKEQDQLVGMILFSEGGKKQRLREQDFNLIQSIGLIASIAIKNAHTYEKAYHEARTDHLTGVLNRRYFYEILQTEFEQSKEGSIALLIVNLDDFKLFNQLYGVKQGDIALKRVAEIIRSSISPTCHVARYSGKEFAVILPAYDVFTAKKLAESLRDQIMSMKNRSTEYRQKAITVSIGISVAPYGAKTVKELVENAEQAIYQIKRKGKNAIKIFDTFVQPESPHDEINKYAQVYDEFKSTIYALTAAIDAKDHYTFSHSDNVAFYATELAKRLSLNEEIVENIRQAALLHDVGKIGIPEHILNKPGKLTMDEYEVMKGHVEASIDIIRHLPSLDYVIPAVLGHHEYYDGSGYPRRIAGDNIPLTARILCVADAFDAMVSERCYKPAFPVEEALHRLERDAGKQFDPVLVDTFIMLVKQGLISPPGSERLKTPRVIAAIK